jgi:hypothetical protein
VPDHIWPDKPRWSRDGRTLFFLSRHPTSRFNLWATRFDPDRGTTIGAPFPLTSFEAPNLMISPYIDTLELGLAAEQVVLPMLTVTGSIWMLENVDR